MHSLFLGYKQSLPFFRPAPSSSPPYGLINNIDTKANAVIAASVYLSEAPSLPMTQYPPVHTVYVYNVYLFTQRRGGG
jgi:hypothetical protein